MAHQSKSDIIQINMETQKIKKVDVIGKRIRSVYHLKLPYDQKEKYQGRLIIVELDSGLRFSLRQEHRVINEQTGKVSISRYAGTAGLEVVIDSDAEAHVGSPIKTVIIPYEWEFSFGLLLENGYVLHDGFGESDNGALFYLPSPETRVKLVLIDIDK